jgi:flagellar biosynthesis/type III secretory pathway chaperone
MSNSSERLSDLLVELRQLLEEERSILLSGSPERIVGIVERKLAIAERIARAGDTPEAAPPGVETLIGLERYNRGNSIICSAMLRHLTRTLDKLRQHEPHRSYGPDGAENIPPAQTPPLGAA